MEKETAPIEVTYRFQMPEKKEGVNLPPHKLLEMAEEATKLVETLEYKLLCSRSKSMFASQYAFDDNDLVDKIAAALVDGNSTYYFDAASETALQEKKEAGETLLITDDSVLSWQISDATAEINGLPCRYATGKIETPGFSATPVTAWFTDTYPLPFGPQNLHGLPGLIVQGQLGEMTYTATAIKSLGDQEQPIVFPTKGRSILHSEYFDQMKKKGTVPPGMKN